MSVSLRISHLLALPALVAISVPAIAQQPGPAADAASCRQFAQDFYTWYVPIVHKRLKGPASDVAVQRKATVFSPDLLHALKEDSEAQAKVSDDIVGLDFDPFVGGQDPSDRYDLRNPSLKGDRCTVEIWSTLRGHNSPKPTKPDVTAELSHQAGGWQFVNFRYPEDNTDLLSILATLSKERSKH